MSTTEARGSEARGSARVGSIGMKLEAVVIPVSEVDRAKEFYGKLASCGAEVSEVFHAHTPGARFQADGTAHLVAEQAGEELPA